MSFDEDKKVVYEVGQRYPFENFVRPQFLSVQGAFYIEGDTLDGLQSLDNKFTHWKREVRFMVVKTETGSIQWIEFVDDGATYEAVIKPSCAHDREAIKIDILSESHGLFVHRPGNQRQAKNNWYLRQHGIDPL